MEENQDLDLLNGENTETPAASPAETITTGDENQVNPQGAGNVSPEEVAWNDLKGSSQDRFRQMAKMANEARAQAERERIERERLMSTYGGRVPTPPIDNNPGVQDAVKQLSQIGIATREEVQETVNRTVGNLVYNFDFEKLEGRYDGSNGLPKFDRDEYEDFIARHPQYRGYEPVDVYEKMYSDEILDYKLRNQNANQGQGAASRQTTASLRPTKTQVREEPLTPELIEQRLNRPDGREWYEKNKEKISSVLASMSSPE